jgi:hypothetical protein
MGLSNKKKLLPILEIDLGTKKLFYSSQAVKVLDENGIYKQYEGKIKNDGGISRSFSFNDYKASITVSSQLNISNDERLQDIFENNPEGFTSAKLTYLAAEDATGTIDQLIGVVSNPSWDKINFTMQLKDSQRLFFKEVPYTIFDEKTFQTSIILSDVTTYTSVFSFGNPNVDTNINVPGSVFPVRNGALVTGIVSSAFAGKPENFWKGSRVDVIMDQRASDDTNQCSGHFAVVVRSADSTVFFNYNKDKFLVSDDQTAESIFNNTMMLFTPESGEDSYPPQTLTFQLIKNAVPQNADSVGRAIPIIYGSPEKVPMIWAVGQKSTNTNSFGVGDDLFLFAGHKCKLGILPDSTIAAGLTATGANNGVYSYTADNAISPAKDQVEITDGLRVEVYWSLEDKRVVDGKIKAGKIDWIPNPFPKRWPNSAQVNGNAYSHRDKNIRLISPLHRIKVMSTLRGEQVHAVQLRGGEFDWYDLSTRLETRGQYPIRYGMGNSKLYISTDGMEDDLDGFYTGHIKSSLPSTSINIGDDLENQSQSTLIKNPADIMLHFLMNYTSIDEDKSMIDIESFRKSRQILNGWRFDTAITELIQGESFIDRLCQQCCSIVFMDRGKFKMKTVIPNLLAPKLYLREDEHIYAQKFEFTKTEDIFNSFIFSCNYDYVHEKYSNVFKLDRSNNKKCRDSYARNGFERSKGNIEFRDIADANTAHMLADVYIDLFSRRRTFLSCSLIYNQEVVDGKIEIGDRVDITTSQAPNGWVEKPCVVIETGKYADHMEMKVMEI